MLESLCSRTDGKLLRDVEDGNEDDLEHKKFVPPKPLVCLEESGA